MRPLIIVCDGPNSVGKSTESPKIVKLLAVNGGLRARYFKRPMPEGKAHAKIQELYAQGLRGSPEIEQLMWEDSLEIRKMAVELDVEVAVLDRDNYSQLAYGVEESRWAGELDRYAAEIGVPDLSIFLTASPKVLHNRLTKRVKYAPGTPEPGHTLEECALYREKYRRIAEEVNRRGWPMMEFDTRYTLENQIGRAVLSFVQQKLNQSQVNPE